jgi:hypothetical protein
MKRTRGLGYPFQRRAVWWIQYHVRGKRYRESGGSANRADVIRPLKQRIANAQLGKPVGANIERTTLAELARMLENECRANNRCSRVIKAPLTHLSDYFGVVCRAAEPATESHHTSPGARTPAPRMRRSTAHWPRSSARSRSRLAPLPMSNNTRAAQPTRTHLAHAATRLLFALEGRGA